MSWRSHPVKQNASIAVNESHRNRREKKNSKTSRTFKQMPHRRVPVFLLSPGIKTRGTPCWIYSMPLCLVLTRPFSPVTVCLYIKLVLGIGHWELGIGNLLFGAHSRRSLHCSMCPNDQLPKQPFFDLASFLSFVLEVASHPGVLGKL